MRRLFLIGLLWVSMVTSAFADQIDVADILKGTGDTRSDAYFNMIFGPLWSGPNQTTLISSLISNFDVLFFAIGAALFVYNIIVGVTETAHEGEILGHRHSALWVPLRTLLAGAALIPTPTGYNVAQHAVAYVVNVGTSTATFFWDQSVDLVVEKKLPVVGSNYASLDAQFVQSLWQMELCRAVYNEEVAKGGNDLEGISRSWSTRSGTTQMAYSLKGVYGACGVVTLPAETAAFDRLAKSAGRTYQDYANSMQQAVTAMAETIAPVAGELAQAISRRQPLPPYRDLKSDLDQWAKLFGNVTAPYADTDELQKSGQQIADEPESLKVTPIGDDKSQALAGNLKSGGWTQAGFYYQLISRLSADATSVATAMPKMTPGDAIGDASNPTGRVRNSIASELSQNNWYLWGSANGDAKKFLDQIAATYNGAIEWWNESVARSGIRAFTNQRAAFADSASGLSDWLPSPTFFADTFEWLNPLDTTQDPMIALVKLGTEVATWVTAATAALTALAVIPWVGTGITVFSNLFGLVISGLGMVGLFIAFILPMVPAMIWVIGILAFFLIVCEAIFAAPLWAIAHLSMEGHGMSGRQARRGYVMILAIMLTPMLMLFGLFLGMILFRIGGVLINSGLYYAISSAQSLVGDSPIGLMWLLGIFVVMLFVAAIYLVIIERSFALISEFPGRIFRWFDHIGDDLDGETGQRIGVIGRGAGAGAAAAVAASGQRMIGLGEGGRRRRLEAADEDVDD